MKSTKYIHFLKKIHAMCMFSHLNLKISLINEHYKKKQFQITRKNVKTAAHHFMELVFIQAEHPV